MVPSLRLINQALAAPPSVSGNALHVTMSLAAINSIQTDRTPDASEGSLSLIAFYIRDLEVLKQDYTMDSCCDTV